MPAARCDKETTMANRTDRLSDDLDRWITREDPRLSRFAPQRRSRAWWQQFNAERKERARAANEHLRQQGRSPKGGPLAETESTDDSDLPF